MSPSLEREKELLRGGPKREDCCGSLCAWAAAGRKLRYFAGKDTSVLSHK
jgi:hypothetical protein